jgi:hypothetical protein
MKYFLQQSYVFFRTLYLFTGKAEELYLRSIRIGRKLFGPSYSGLEYDYRGLVQVGLRYNSQCWELPTVYCQLGCRSEYYFPSCYRSGLGSFIQYP